MSNHATRGIALSRPNFLDGTEPCITSIQSIIAVPSIFYDYSKIRDRGMPETKQPRHSSLSTVTKHYSNVTNHLFCDGKTRGQKRVFCDSLLGSRGVFS